MIIPNKLPIARMEDYHTHYLGKISDGRLFWGYQTFVFSGPHSIENRIDYAVLHIFDWEGNYLKTDYSSTKANDYSDQLLEDKLSEMVSGLGSIEYHDIEIKLFQTHIDDILFGLIPNTENTMINLQPSLTISFMEPWDGEYYT